MKRTIQALTLAAALAAVGNPAAAAVSVGLSVGDGGNHFDVAVGDYYQVPPARVEVIRQRNIPEEEMPVVFFIARQAHVAPEDVVALRSRHMPWRDVARHYGIGADAFYVETTRADGPYGRFRRYRRDQWRRVRLEDADIVNFVNLRFLSEHYHCTPDQIVQWRAGGRRFSDMDRDLYRPANRPLMRNVADQDRRDARQDRRDDRKDVRKDDRRDRQDGDGKDGGWKKDDRRDQRDGDQQDRGWKKDDHRDDDNR